MLGPVGQGGDTPLPFLCSPLPGFLDKNNDLLFRNLKEVRQAGRLRWFGYPKLCVHPWLCAQPQPLPSRRSCAARRTPSCVSALTGMSSVTRSGQRRCGGCDSGVVCVCLSPDQGLPGTASVSVFSTHVRTHGCLQEVALRTVFA